MGNEINRDSAVYFDSAARVVPARLARGNSRDAARRCGPAKACVAGKRSAGFYRNTVIFRSFRRGNDIYLSGYFYERRERGFYLIYCCGISFGLDVRVYVFIICLSIYEINQIKNIKFSDR